MIKRKLFFVASVWAFIMPSIAIAANKPPFTTDDLSKKSAEISSSRSATVTTEKAPSETAQIAEEETQSTSPVSESITIDPDERPASERGKQGETVSSNNANDNHPNNNSNNNRLYYLGGALLVVLMVILWIAAQRKRIYNKK